MLFIRTPSVIRADGFSSAQRHNPGTVEGVI